MRGKHDYVEMDVDVVPGNFSSQQFVAIESSNMTQNSGDICGLQSI